MGLFEELQSLMIKYRFRPEKKLSQFYCINEALLLFLVKQASINEKDVVLEIGPGCGFLTKLLLEKCKVVAVEKDPVMIELLNKEFSKEISEKKLVLINKDILEEDIDELGVNKVVALPPYHISSDLILKLTLSNIEKAILVFDIGFIEKITSFEGFTTYNALTAFLNLNSKIEVLEKVSPISFFPKPNCVSGVIKIDYNRKNNSKEFFIFLKELFRHKNKDLHRGLKQAQVFLEKSLGWGEKQASKFNKLKNSTEKIYSIEAKEFLKIFEELNK